MTYLRETPRQTITDVLSTLGDRPQAVTVPTNAISVDLLDERCIKWGDETVPATGDAVVAIGDWLDIPSKFLGRIPLSTSQSLINDLLSAKTEAAVLMVGGKGLEEVLPVNHKHLDVRDAFEIAARVVGSSGIVVTWRNDAGGFGFEVTVSEESRFSAGGAPEVGDITRGGLRFGQDSKHNLAPWVQPYLYRLVCTNGMEIPDHSLKVNARGMSIDDIAESLETFSLVRGLRTTSYRSPSHSNRSPKSWINLVSARALARSMIPRSSFFQSKRILWNPGTLNFLGSSSGREGSVASKSQFSRAITFGSSVFTMDLPKSTTHLPMHHKYVHST